MEEGQREKEREKEKEREREREREREMGKGGHEGREPRPSSDRHSSRREKKSKQLLCMQNHCYHDCGIYSVPDCATACSTVSGF